MHAKTWACVLALILATADTVATQPVSGEEGRTGNAVLMERKAEQQRRIRDEVLRTLREKGQLPENGTVSFTALAVPDPGRAGRLALRIETLEIFPAPMASGTGPAGPAGADDPGSDMARALAPVDISRIVELDGLDVPVGGKVRDTVTMKEGRPVFTDPPIEQGKRGQP
jgi:hypothetical protein